MKPTKPESEALIGKQSPEAPLLCVDTDDCKATINELKVKGVTVIQEPNQEPWGTSAMVVDLYGNAIYIVQPSSM
jgi:uncharacterized glyoxalase superfamily protein PhnB